MRQVILNYDTRRWGDCTGETFKSGWCGPSTPALGDTVQIYPGRDVIFAGRGSDR